MLNIVAIGWPGEWCGRGGLRGDAVEFERYDWHYIIGGEKLFFGVISKNITAVQHTMAAASAHDFFI